MFFSNKKNCPFPDSSLTVNIYSFVDTERNTVPTTNTKPISSDRGKPVSTEIILRKQILAAYTGYSPADPSEDCEHISFDIILLIFFHNVLPVPAFLSEVLLRTDLLLVSTSSSCRGWTVGSFVRSCQDQGNPALE